MKPLEINFTYKGFEFRQEWRSEDFAIYSQWCDFKDGNGLQLIAYESIKIKKNKAGERFGKHFEASESYPSDKEFGINAWTSKTLIEAQNILIKHFPGIAFNFSNLLLPTAVEGTIISKGMNIDTTPELAETRGSL